MKLPKYFVDSPQAAINAGINGFALTLLAESFADVPDKFGDENIALLGVAHNRQEVWFVMSKTAPKQSDFMTDELLEALKAAQEELRLLHAKDTLTVYDPTLKSRMALVIAKAEGR